MKSLLRWAEREGLPTRVPEEFGPSDERCLTKLNFQNDPRIDFGRVIKRTPTSTFEPLNQEQLASCLAEFGRRGIRFKVRGAGHSSGGQTLIDDGVVLDLRSLDRINDDHPDREEVSVEAGVHWLKLIEHLAPQGRRPVSITGNPRSTIAGTLAVGGFGDTSHIHGLQVDSVVALTVITPDGQRHEVRAGDELFRYTLAGRGQLGVIASATLRTLRRPMTVGARMLRWNSVANFVRDAALISTFRYYEYMRAWIKWRPESPDGYVEAIAGNFTDSPSGRDIGLKMISPAKCSEPLAIDLLSKFAVDPYPGWTRACPALEVVLPLPRGLELYRELYRELGRAGVLPTLKTGVAIGVVPRRASLPLTPLPPTDLGLIFAVRPQLDADAAKVVLPIMRTLGFRALEGGGKLYLMSVEPEKPGFLQHQFGDALEPFLALKQRWDPQGICNPGLLEKL